MKKIYVGFKSGNNENSHLYVEPSKNSLVQIKLDGVCKCGCGQKEYKIVGYEKALNGKTQYFLEECFREPNFTNHFTRELASKQKWEDENWKDIPKRIFTTKARF